MTRWNQVRGNLVDWYAVAADRTGTWTRLGVGHYDKYGIQRRRERLLHDLGVETHRLLTTDGDVDLMDEPRVREILDRLNTLDEQMRAKEEEIAAMRRPRAHAPAGQSQGGTPTLPPETLDSQEESQPGA